MFNAVVYPANSRIGNQLVVANSDSKAKLLPNIPRSGNCYITADELSGNAAFQGLLSVGLEVMSTHAAVIRDMDAEQLHAHQAEVEALLAQLRGQMQDRSEISDPELRTRHSEPLYAERLAAGRRDGKGC